MQIGDLISIVGCGLDNICDNCTTGSCSKYVKDGSIIAIVTYIESQPVSNYDKIFYFPVTATEDEIANKEKTFYPSRRRFCKLLKSRPDEIIELQF